MAFAVPLSLDSTQALRGPNSHLFHVDASRDRMYHRRNRAVPTPARWNPV